MVYWFFCCALKIKIILQLIQKLKIRKIRKRERHHIFYKKKRKFKIKIKLERGGGGGDFTQRIYKNRWTTVSVISFHSYF